MLEHIDYQELLDLNYLLNNIFGHEKGKIWTVDVDLAYLKWVLNAENKIIEIPHINGSFVYEILYEEGYPIGLKIQGHTKIYHNTADFLSLGFRNYLYEENGINDIDIRTEEGKETFEGFLEIFAEYDAKKAEKDCLDQYIVESQREHSVALSNLEISF